MSEQIRDKFKNVSGTIEIKDDYIINNASTVVIHWDNAYSEKIDFNIHKEINTKPDKVKLNEELNLYRLEAERNDKTYNTVSYFDSDLVNSYIEGLEIYEFEWRMNPEMRDFPVRIIPTGEEWELVVSPIIVPESELE